MTARSGPYATLRWPAPSAVALLSLCVALGPSGAAAAGGGCLEPPLPEEHEQSFNTSVFMVTTALVIISIAFEHGEHFLLHKPSKVTRPVVRSMFGELTALGFIGVILFVVESTPVLKTISKAVFEESHAGELVNIIHTVHMALFLIMVLFLASVLLLMIVAMRQQNTWSDYELACLNRPGLLQGYSTYLTRAERTNFCVKLCRWGCGLRDRAYERVVYNGLRSRFVQPGAAHQAHHKLAQVNESGEVGITLTSDTAEVYRKKLVVHAFRTRDPVTFNKHWGTSKGSGGDYVIVGVDDDLYVCPKAVFESSYQPVAGEPNKFRKTGHMFARRMPHEFKVRTSAGLQRGPTGAYLVQDCKSGEQYSVTSVEFEENYELVGADDSAGKDQNELPKDFDLAAYLTERLGSTLAEIVSVDWRTWLIMEVVVCILWVVRLTNSHLAFVIVDHGLACAWMTFALMMARKMAWIRNQLVPRSLLRAHPFANEQRIVPLAAAIARSRRNLLAKDESSTPPGGAGAGAGAGGARKLERIPTISTPTSSVRFRTEAGEELLVDGAILSGAGEENEPKFLRNPLATKVTCCKRYRSPPNRQEQLFWFGAEGPAFVIRFVRTTLLFMSLYASTNIMMLMKSDCKTIVEQPVAEYANFQCTLTDPRFLGDARYPNGFTRNITATTTEKLLFDTTETAVPLRPLDPAMCSIRMALCVIPPIIAALALPRIITLFVTVSNVEMMTKQKVVNEVLRKQRTQKSMRALRLLSALRAYTRRATRQRGDDDDEESKGGPGTPGARHSNIKGAAVRVYGAVGTARYISRRHQLREAFAIFDRENTGHVRAENIKSLFQLLGLGDQAEAAAESILLELDTDGAGAVEFEEFFDWNAAQEENVDPEDLTRDIFDIIDRDHSADITVSELRNTLSSLGAVMTSEDILTIVREADHNNTGSITYHEFQELMRNNMKGQF